MAPKINEEEKYHVVDKLLNVVVKRFRTFLAAKQFLTENQKHYFNQLIIIEMKGGKESENRKWTNKKS